MNRIFATGVAGFALLAAVGCSSPDYEGEGDEFVIEGYVVDVGERSLKVVPTDIIEARGHAGDWFTEGDETRIHNNYKNDWCNIKTIPNEVLTLDGGTELEDLEINDWVQVEGNVRESKESCGKTPAWDHRPTFGEVHEILR